MNYVALIYIFNNLLQVKSRIIYYNVNSIAAFDTHWNFMNKKVVQSVDQSHYRIVSINDLSQCDEQKCYYTVRCLTGG